MFRFSAQRLAVRVKTAVAEKVAKAVADDASVISAPAAELAATGTSTLAVPRGASPPSTSSPFLPANRISVLKNGLTVVSRESVDNIDHVGFFFRAGPAYLQPHERGYATLLAKALQHTNRVLSTHAIVKSFAGNQCLNSNDVVGRQLIGLTAEGLSEDLDMMLDTFAQMLFVPAFQHWEIKETLHWVREFQYKNIVKENPYEYIVDLAHRAAFGDDGVGGPTLLPPHLHEKFDMGVLVNLWQRTCHLSNLALVASSTWLHDTLCERVATCEEILNNESDTARPEPIPATFESGTVVDFHNRKGYALTVGLAAPFAAMAFEGPPTTDATGVAAVKVLLQHPQLRKLASCPYAPQAISAHHGYEHTGLVTFVSQGIPSATAAVNRDIVALLEEVASGRARFDLDLARLGARLSDQATRRRAVEEMAIQWAAGAYTSEIDNVTIENVQNVAERLLDKAPALVYHGDPATITRDHLL